MKATLTIDELVGKKIVNATFGENGVYILTEDGIGFIYDPSDDYYTIVKEHNNENSNTND